MIKDGYVLVIPSWFPSKVDLFNGDFNQRTVKALSLNLNQVVVYVVPDKTIKGLKIEREAEGNIITIRGYFTKSTFKIIDFFRYFIIYHKLIHSVIKENGKPLYLHTYVFFPAGIVSFYFAKRLKLKNVLTEHWSIIYPDNEYSISKRNIFFRAFLKRLIRSFDLIFPVVNALKDAVCIWAPNVKNVVIPNVVNTHLFSFNDENKYDELTFIHVSCLEAHKNPLGILEAFESKALMKKRVSLKLIGPIREELLDKVNGSLSLKSRVEFLGEVPNSEVAKIMKKSHVLVMNSFYESQPCVILEALCCGLPIVSTDVGGISEVVNNDNGVLFKQGELTSALEKMIATYSGFNKKNISENAIKKFSEKAVSAQVITALKHQKII